MDVPESIRSRPRSFHGCVALGLAQAGVSVLQVSFQPMAFCFFPLVFSPFQTNTPTRHTKPGGWVEFKDWDFILVSNDNSLPKDGYIYKYHQLLFSALDKIGRPCNPGPNLKKWVEDAGYKNVTERVYPVPIGRWPKDKKLVR